MVSVARVTAISAYGSQPITKRSNSPSTVSRNVFALTHSRTSQRADDCEKLYVLFREPIDKIALNFIVLPGIVKFQRRFHHSTESAEPTVIQPLLSNATLKRSGRFRMVACCSMSSTCDLKAVNASRLIPSVSKKPTVAPITLRVGNCVFISFAIGLRSLVGPPLNAVGGMVSGSQSQPTFTTVDMFRSYLNSDL